MRSALYFPNMRRCYSFSIKWINKSKDNIFMFMQDHPWNHPWNHPWILKHPMELVKS